MSTADVMTRVALFMGGPAGPAFHAWYRPGGVGSLAINDGCCHVTVELTVAV